MFILYCLVFWVICVIIFWNKKEKTPDEIRADFKAKTDKAYAAWVEANPEAVKAQAALVEKNKADAEARAPFVKVYNEAMANKNKADAEVRRAISDFAKVKAAKFAMNLDDYDKWKANVKAAKAKAKDAKTAFFLAQNALKPFSKPSDGDNDKPFLVA